MKWLLRSLCMMVVLTLAAACMQAQTCPTSVAEITSPAPGSTLQTNPNGSISFTWCNASADYFVTVETVPGAHDVYFAFTGGAGGGAGQNFLDLGPACAPGAPTGCIPAQGEAIFFTLQTVKNKQILGTFQYTFTAPGTLEVPAVMLFPSPGSALPSSSVTFNWSTGTGASMYALYVGRTLGGTEIYADLQGTSLSRPLDILPTDGSTVFVRLWTLFGSTWQFNDYTYTAASFSRAAMASPTPGSALTSSTQTFTWNGSAGASMYALYVGTTAGGFEIYADLQGTNLSQTLGSLPTDGSTVFVRLWTLLGGTWQFNDYTYTAVSFGKAVMLSPASGSTLTSSTVTFNWNGTTGASMYALYVGTTQGGTEIYADVQGTNLSRTLDGLPTNGSTVFVRLWTLIGGTWQFNDYTYTAF